MGELVSEVFDFDGGRGVTVYLPSEPPESVVYAGDGQLIAPWGAEVGGRAVRGRDRGHLGRAGR